MYRTDGTQSRYDAPLRRGYVWQGNSSRERSHDAIVEYAHYYPASTHIAVPFNPDNINPNDKYWKQAIKWAIYKKVANADEQ